MINKDLKRRIIEISYSLGLSHISSCLTSVDIIKEIYDIKKTDEKFILSAGHAHLAHLVLMRASDTLVKQQIERYGIHCERAAGCDCSTGSLGQGLPIAVGMALADRNKNVYCLISDGECAEGSISEALRIIKEQRLKNLKLYINWNGWGAYRAIGPILDVPLDILDMPEIRAIDISDFPFLKGQVGHYRVMDEKDYKQAMEALR